MAFHLNPLRITGFCLIGISLLQWPSLLVVHLLPVSAWGKAAVYGGVLIVGGIFFWSGSLILGGNVAVMLFRAAVRKWKRAQPAKGPA